MIHRQHRTCRLFAGLWLAMLSIPGVCSAVDATFDLVQTKTGVYSNVTVTTKAEDFIIIQHARGLASLKVIELSIGTQHALGYDRVNEDHKGSSLITAKARALAGAIPTKQIEQAWSKHAPAGTPPLKLDSNALLVILGLFVVLYLFFCYCGSLVCQKAGKPAGWLIWFPALQFIPLFRAANMSPLWVLAMFVPVLNFAPHFLWSVRMAAVRGQGLATAILLFLPTYPLAFAYLAFTNASTIPGDASPTRKLKATGLVFDQA